MRFRRHRVPALPYPPVSPEGVRIVRPDGTQINCELRYVGVARNCHVWEVCGAIYTPGCSLAIAMMPPRTGVRFAAAEEPTFNTERYPGLRLERDDG